MSAPMGLPSRGRVARGGLLKFGSERACAPPALSATRTHLGRLRRVVLPVKRDCSPDNPKVPATTLPACLIASGLALAQCTKVYPGAAGLARLHYGGCSMVRGRLQQPHQSAPKCTAPLSRRAGPVSERHQRRECKSRVTLLLRDADSGQIDHMAAEPTHMGLTTHAPAQAG